MDRNAVRPIVALVKARQRFERRYHRARTPQAQVVQLPGLLGFRQELNTYRPQPVEGER